MEGQTPPPIVQCPKKGKWGVIGRVAIVFASLLQQVLPSSDGVRQEGEQLPSMCRLLTTRGYLVNRGQLKPRRKAIVLSASVGCFDLDFARKCACFQSPAWDIGCLTGDLHVQARRQPTLNWAPDWSHTNLHVFPRSGSSGRTCLCRAHYRRIALILGRLQICTTTLST